MSSSAWNNVVFALTFANKVDKSERIYSFGQRLCECISRSGVDQQIASATPFVPVAYGKDDEITGHENWCENFWDVCIP